MSEERAGPGVMELQMGVRGSMRANEAKRQQCKAGSKRERECE